MSRAFVDSGAFIAFLDRSDGWHEAARSLFAHPPAQLFTSSHVVAETYGWFLHRLGENAGRAFRSLLSRLEPLEILTGDRAHYDATNAKLDKLRGHKLSWVDASSLVWLSDREIATVWGTDHHLACEGARVLPGSPSW